MTLLNKLIAVKDKNSQSSTLKISLYLTTKTYVQIRSNILITLFSK